MTLLFLATVSLYAVVVTLTWCPSPDTNVTGYAIYYGTGNVTNWSPDVYLWDTNNPCDFTLISRGSNWLGNYTTRINVGNTNVATVTNLVTGVSYYFVATAYDASGLESLPSNEVSYTAPTNSPPSIPQEFQLIDVK